MKEITNSKVIISGKVLSEPRFNHEVFGEVFYVFDLESTRTSGVVDIIPIMVSERLVCLDDIKLGKCFEIQGQFRSYNKHEDGKNHLILSVFARSIIESESNDKNEIELEGYICKSPIYRETPLGREIADLLVAVNRPYGKSDYIPCIAWGRNARYVSNFEVGTKIYVKGRIQSREYNKKIDEQMTEIRIAYEVSVSQIREENEDEE